MWCSELFLATEVILKLLDPAFDKLPQLVLQVDKDVASMAITHFKMPWVVVKEENGFTTVRRIESKN